MFSEYASKFLSQSQARISAASGISSLSGNPNEAPLFYSAAEFDDDDSNPSASLMAESMAGAAGPSTRTTASHIHPYHFSRGNTTPRNASGTAATPELSQSRFPSSSVYATSNNSSRKGAVGSSFMPKYIMDGGSAVATPISSPNRSLYSSRYKNSGIKEEDSDTSNGNESYDSEDDDDEEAEEGNASPAFLSIDDNPASNIQFSPSNPLESSVSSFDETPQPSLYVDDDGTSNNVSFNYEPSSAQQVSSSRPSFLPNPQNLKNSIINFKNSLNIASHSFLSSPQTNPTEMESVQLTQTLKGKRVRNNSALQHYNNSDGEEPPDDIAIEKPHYANKYQSDPLIDSDVLPGVAVPFDPSNFLPRQTDLEAQDNDMSRFIPPEVQQPVNDMPKFDAVWANVYLGLISSMMATSLIIWLRTDVPSSVPFKDTMYVMLQKSGRYLFMDIFIASLASIVWIFLLKRYSIALFYLSIVTVPCVLFGLTIYPLIMSYRSTYGGNTTQDVVMRWTTLIPLSLGIFWCWFIYKGRGALNRALGIIKLATSIMSDNPPLVILGYASVGLFILATWFWLHIFMRVFLRGHTVLNHGTTGWVLDPKSWALAAFYIFMYLWSWGVISGFQRSTISAVVSQWYFYRNAQPQPSSADMTYVALQYSLSTQFGTICLSSLMRLVIRLPLVFLPRRAVGMFQLMVYNFVPTSVISLTNPLALSNAIINSQSLVDSAQAIASLRYLDHGYDNPSVRSGHSWTAYRLAKMLLTAARGVMSLILGYSAWVHAAMYSDGSLYGYMAGLIAGFIGWFVLGASEGILSMIVDAAFLCFAIDNAARGGHCTEADRHFGGI